MPFKDEIYNVDWNRLTRWVIPVRRRWPRTLAFLNALTSAVNEVNTRFLYFRAYTNYRLGITPQVVYLEKLLNDRFDVVLKRIIIVKAIALEGVPFFMKIEMKPKKFWWHIMDDGYLVLYTKAETLQFTVDFIVKVPIGVPFDINELTAYLDGDVLQSKNYKVQIV